jgi:hypothetical protein
MIEGERALRMILRKLTQIFALLRRPVDDGRAGGGCLCERCGRLYVDHAQDPLERWMTILCDGTMVKL